MDAQPYNEKFEDITWEKCTLRTWLNRNFFNKAFSANEQSAILLTNVDNSKGHGYSGYNTDGGNITQDRIFLLSYAEANKYFNVTHSSSNNIKSRVQPTAYATKREAQTSSIIKTADGAAVGWWWLRSPGDTQDKAMSVSFVGSIDNNYVSFVSGSVRPVLWLNLESEYFR